MRLALYQPDIAQNAGAMLRLAACLGVSVDLIEPCGFVFGDAKLRRAGMDYLDHVDLVRHISWDAFRPAVPGRLVLLTTKASIVYTDAAFRPEDTLMVGRESAGVPDAVQDSADLRVRVPMRRACGPSMSRWRRRWCWARPCARPDPGRWERVNERNCGAPSPRARLVRRVA
ncbi:MAG: TrmH family RNA methyltransferase [Aliidongia sp.]